jgi:TetR/AcrR family transcriptional regulator
MERMRQVLEEGIASGELIPADPSQILYAALGANVFYFLSAPLMRLMQGSDPLECDALKFRRKATIEYLGLALFIDREHGGRVAAQVLDSTPMPRNREVANRAIENSGIEAGSMPESHEIHVKVRHK